MGHNKLKHSKESTVNKNRNKREEELNQKTGMEKNHKYKSNHKIFGR